MPGDRSTADLTIRPLAPDTWRAFADLVERHNGVFGGCWCTYFHSLSRDPDRTYESNRDLKCQLVEHGRAHAALVFDGDEAVAWAEFGPPGELPNIHHRQEYEAGLVDGARLPGHLHLRGPTLPTRRRRRAGTTRSAGPDLPGGWRGGRGIPARHVEAPQGKKMSSSFLTTAPAGCTRRPASPSSGRRDRRTA